jgi:predicted nucleic acid-binding protein
LGLTIEETQARIEQIKTLFILKSDQSDIFDNWESLVEKYRVAGKNAHDTRLVAAMLTHGISHILTFNVDDFKRFKDVISVVSPQEVLANIRTNS